ncbi:MAG: Subtilisin-like serine protease-like protein [Deltaproteobacteria bacterium]|nr:Subtilisin-like serine protease-like protein [Deltaproteobacteria bacterium]
MFDFFKRIHIISVRCFIIMVAVGCFLVGHADGANENEAKIANPGGYNLLRSKSLDKGSVKIIIKVRTAFTPEPLLQETDKHAQWASTLRIQDQVVTQLEAKGHKLRSIRKYKYTPHIAMTVDSATLDALISSPDVISVEEDIPVPPLLGLSVPRIGAPQLHENSVTGSGWAVAVLDTGVDKTHPFLQDSVVSEACYSTNDLDYDSSSLCPGGLAALETEGSAMPYSGNCPTGECDHGTHVAGIAAGRSGIAGSPGPGVAPEAYIIAIQVFSRFDSDYWCDGQSPCALTWSSDQMAGLERVYELRNTYSIASVNMSLGGGYYSSNCDENSLKTSIDNLREAGIATVIASGNDGLCGYINAPACISSAISVGATYDDDTVTFFSNSASFLNLLAPGQWIESSVPGGGYSEWAGTSMAAPHVTGAWALLKQANPDATVDEILSSLTSTGLSVTDQYCSSVTKKRVNVYEAFSLLGNNASLTVSKTGVGTGTVTSDLSGIDCGETCSSWFTRDTVVTLSATADAGSAFGGWNGGGCIGTDPCIVNLSTATSVTALFRKDVTIGTKITITGINFGSRKGKVLIGDVSIKIDRDGWSDNTITCTVNRVPRASPGIFPLTIKPRGAASIILDGAIDVMNPEIDPLSIDHGFPGAKIKINGKFFGSRKQRPYLEYQGKTRRCKIDSWAFDSNTGDSEMVFIVPNRLAVRKYQLNVKNRIGTVGAGDFTIDPLPLP